MICENCNRKIQPKEHYYEVIERFNNEVISQKYVHKKCQDNHENKLKDSLQLNQMGRDFINDARNMLGKMSGEEPKRIVTIT